MCFGSRGIAPPSILQKNSRIETDGSIIMDLSSHYQKPLTQKIEVIKTAIQANVRISFMYYYERGEIPKNELQFDDYF